MRGGGGRCGGGGSIKELKTGAIVSVTKKMQCILLCGVSGRLLHMGLWEKGGWGGGGGNCGMPWRLSVATTYSVLIQL